MGVEFPCLNLHPFMTQNRSLTTRSLTICELGLYTVDAVDRVDEENQDKYKGNLAAQGFQQWIGERIGEGMYYTFNIY